MNSHLSKDQISKCLIGDGTPQETQHVSACAACSAELARLESSFSQFRGSVRHWSNRQFQHPIPEGFVMTGSDRLVQWVNPAFTAMCGYSLDELRGKSLGPILQGEKSDRGAIARMRSALHARRPCRETLVNYHKDGSAYVVDIEITPILDEEQQPLWFVARERKLELPVAA